MVDLKPPGTLSKMAVPMLIMPALARTMPLWDLTLRTARAMGEYHRGMVCVVLNGTPPGISDSNAVKALLDATKGNRRQHTVFAGPVTDDTDKVCFAKHKACVTSRGVARSWNIGLQAAATYGCTHAVFLNNDVVPRDGTIDHLLDYLYMDPRAIITCATDVANLEDGGYNPHEGINNTSRNAFSLFATRVWDFTQTLDRFDENFAPMYWEDHDIIIRATLKGRPIAEVTGALFDHTGSATVSLDPDARQKNHVTFSRNGAYLLRKWGTTARHPLERDIPYKRPFNDPARGINDWDPIRPDPATFEVW